MERMFLNLIINSNHHCFQLTCAPEDGTFPLLYLVCVNAIKQLNSLQGPNYMKI